MKKLLNFVLSLFESDQHRIERYLVLERPCGLRIQLKEIDTPYRKLLLNKKRAI